MPAVDRASSFTIENAKVRRYSDFLTNFDLNPMTGFLATVTNEDSVKQSLRNLILTDRTERFYNAHIGSKITSLLFEPVDTVTEELLSTTIRETIDNCEKRVERVGVLVQSHDNYNGYLISIEFSIKTIPDRQFDFNLFLRRAR